MQLASLIEKKLKEKEKGIVFLESQQKFYKELKLQVGKRYVYEAEGVDEATAVLDYYQCGSESDAELTAKLDLLVALIDEPCRQQLSVKENTASSVTVEVRRSNGAQGIVFVLESDKHPRYLEKRLHAFLQNIEETLNGITAEELKKCFADWLKEKEKTPSKMSDKNMHYRKILTSTNGINWTEFNKTDRLKSLKQDILQFCQEYVGEKATKSSRMSVHLSPAVDEGCLPASLLLVASDKLVKISDVAAFKRGMKVWP
jgi:insulysin